MIIIFKFFFGEAEVDGSNCSIWNEGKFIDNNQTTHSTSFKTSNKTRTFKCGDCPYAAKIKTRLKQHLLIHENLLGVFKCDSCSYTTNLRPYLKSHALVYKRIEETEIFKCDQCSFVTNRKFCLKRQGLTRHENDGKVPKCESART